jgi:aspartate kinase
MSDLVKASPEAAVRRPECMVMKFGGTSVEDAAAIRRVLQLVKRRLRHHPVVVVSALAGVTDQLLAAAKAVAEGNRDAAEQTLAQLRQRHGEISRELVDGEVYEHLWGELESGLRVVEDLLRTVGAAGSLSPRVQDRLLGMGEVLSSKMVASALLKAGFDAVWVDARECIITDAAHTQATPLWEETDRQLELVVLPLVQAGRVPVLGGFMGATRDGIPTTLGRGGSDFSAAVVGAGLHASRIEIWTDVDGVMTTDPNLCAEARRITSMSFHEAAELAYFGAKVLHPATLAPAMRRNIPVWVLNSRNPEGGGTEIVANVCDGGGRVKAITAKRGIAVVDVEPLRWLAPELMREVFEVFERYEQRLDLLSASRGSLSLLVSSTAALPAIAEELKGLAHVHWENHKALVCLVGEKIRRRPEVASQVFHAISDIEMRMICQGASERNISFLVDESRAEETVRRLHDLLFAAPSPGRLPAAPSHAMCQAGGAWG